MVQQKLHSRLPILSERKMPTCLVTGHRGFKGKYTENTLNSFQHCYETGAPIFETDVWTTRDGVLVISHDVNTKRVFCDENGNETDYNILETDYKDLMNLRTIGSGERLLRFVDVLNWYASYAGEKPAAAHKIMLDIKNANPPELLRLLMEDMASVGPSLAWWFSRVQIGVWNLRFVRYLNQDPYFQELFKDRPTHDGFSHFDLFHISMSWEDSMTFLAYNDYLRLAQKDRIPFYTTGLSLIYMTTWSPEFLKKCVPAMRLHDMKFYSWTINTKPQLDYLCAVGQTYRFREYGIITDYPDKMVAAVSGETQSRVVLPWYFHALSYVYAWGMAAARVPGITSAAQFEAVVDPKERLPVKPRLGNKIFAMLQSVGIF